MKAIKDSVLQIRFLSVVALVFGVALRADEEKLSVGIEVFVIDPSIVTVEKKEKKEGKAEEASSSQSNSAQNPLMQGIQQGVGEKLGKVFGKGKRGGLLGSGNTNAPVTVNPANVPEFEGDRVRVPPKTASLGLRQTEAYYLAVRLAKQLERQGAFNFVAVIPTPSHSNANAPVNTRAFDYVLRVALTYSDGNEVGFEGWYFTSIDGLEKRKALRGIGKYAVPETAYEGEKDPNTGEVTLEADPYDSAIKGIVESFVAEVESSKLPVSDHKQITFVRYGSEMAPDVFANYPIKFKFLKGYELETAPSHSNSFVAKVAKLHAAELSAHGQFTDHYYVSADGATVRYNLWRKSTRDALMEYEAMKQEKNRVNMEITGLLVGKYGADVLIRLANGYDIRWESEEDRVGAYFIQELTKSMVESDGYVTVIRPPSMLNVAKNNHLHEHANRLQNYNTQMETQAQSVADLQGVFATMSTPKTLELLTRTKTYDGKIDQALIQFREDLKAEYESETSVAITN